MVRKGWKEVLKLRKENGGREIGMQRKNEI